MRIQLKIVLAAALGLALASNATAQTAVTRIDNFKCGKDIAAIGESWRNYVITKGDGTASISNEDKAVNPNGYAELKDVSLYISTWNDWAQAAIELKTENNGVHYDLSQCSGGFRYKYKGNDHRFNLRSLKDGKQAVHYSDISYSPSKWTEVKVSPGDFRKDSYAEITMDLDLSKVNSIEWTVRPEAGETVTGDLRIKDFECLGTLAIDETVKEKCPDGTLSAEERCEADDSKIWGENDECRNKTPAEVCYANGNVWAYNANACATVATRIDNFESGSNIAITGEPWYQFTVANGNGTVSISNGGEGETINQAGYAELKDISLRIPTWDDWAQATIGLDTKNNGDIYSLAQCSGFRYKYKGIYHRFILNGVKEIDENHSQEITWSTSLPTVTDWTQVIVKGISLNLSKINAIHWTVRPESDDLGLTIKGYLQIKDFECIGLEALDVSKVTPIHLSQTPGKWNILAHTANNAIMLQNLPKNAKVEVYNLQGKRIYSAHSENSQILKILVQTKGMYIVKVSSGSKTEMLRIAVR